MSTLIRRKNSIHDTRIAGLYDLAETIGRGHFAVVKAARHVFTGERVAVKVIDKTKIDAISKESLFQEVRCMKLVQHPNIVRLYEVIDTQTRLFLVLELGDYDLFDYIMRKGESGMEEQEAQRYFFQIAHAIAYCHQLHVVHRDLKPENVVFMEKLQMVKLTDFGFSNLFTPGQHLDTSCGSLAYSAPEILLGDSYDAPSVDVWSLGVILYMMMCGRLPFQEANDSETLTKILDCSYDLPAPLSDACKDLIRKLLVRQPAMRASLPEILEMPWVRAGDCGHAALLPLVLRQNVAVELHDQIVEQMAEGNIASVEETCKALERNDYTYITATYYLLLERYLKKERYEQALQILVKQQESNESEEMQLASTESAQLAASQSFDRRLTPLAQQPITEEDDEHPTTADSAQQAGDQSRRIAAATTPSTLTVSSKPGVSPAWRQRTCSIVQEESTEDDDDDVMSVHYIGSRSASPTRGPLSRRNSGGIMLGGGGGLARRTPPIFMELHDMTGRLSCVSGSFSSVSGSRSPSPSGGQTSPLIGAARYRSLPTLSRRLSSRGSSPHLVGICEEGSEMTSSSLNKSFAASTRRSQTLATMRIMKHRKLSAGVESSSAVSAGRSSSLKADRVRRSASCSSSETSDDDERRLSLIRTRFCHRRDDSRDKKRDDDDDDDDGNAGGASGVGSATYDNNASSTTSASTLIARNDPPPPTRSTTSSNDVTRSSAKPFLCSVSKTSTNLDNKTDSPATADDSSSLMTSMHSSPARKMASSLASNSSRIAPPKRSLSAPMTSSAPSGAAAAPSPPNGGCKAAFALMMRKIYFV